jgi:hypothetical protein
VTTAPPLADVVCHVRRLLDTVGDALVAGRVEPLLETDRELARSLDRLTDTGAAATLSPGERQLLKAEIARCLAALGRCRRLGSAFEQLAAGTLALDGHAAGYTRAGQAALVPPGGTLEARG